MSKMTRNPIFGIFCTFQIIFSHFFRKNVKWITYQILLRINFYAIFASANWITFHILGQNLKNAIAFHVLAENVRINFYAIFASANWITYHKKIKI
jgi:hypothetical protein